ncbi:MAG: hypothetical protein VKK59_03455 [Vampirovibrionales bacterium]|nr:hypothetical protein [Vampirovibrionales bacterium]
MRQRVTNTALYYQSAFRLLFEGNPLWLFWLAITGWLSAVFHSQDTMQRVRQRQRLAEIKFKRVEEAFHKVSQFTAQPPSGVRFDCTR